MQKIIKNIKQVYQDWKEKHENYKLLREFEREFYKEFPKDDDKFNIISITIALAIILTIIIISATK